jgi:hypothetical protein
MTRRKIRDEDDAVACLESYERSGLALRDWAQRNGVDGRSLHCWQLNLGERRRPMQLVELVPESRPVSARYVVRAWGFEIEVGDDFDQRTLARLLDVVASC